MKYSSIRCSWNSDRVAAACLGKKKSVGCAQPAPMPAKKLETVPLEELYGAERVAEYRRREAELDSVEALYRKEAGTAGGLKHYVVGCREANWRWLASGKDLAEPSLFPYQTHQYAVSHLVALLKDPARLADLRKSGGRDPFAQLGRALDAVA